MRAPTTSKPDARRALAVASCVAFSCGGEPVPVAPPPPTASVAPEPAGDPVSFELVDTDGKPISSASLQGRISIVLLITTYDVESQAMVQFVSQLLHEHTPRLNAVAVVLEIEKNKMLVEAYARALETRYPIAMAPESWIRGEGAFPGLRSVPSLAILDRKGREAARFSGFMKKHDIDALVREVEAKE